MTHKIHSDGTITLGTGNDPAIHRVKGRQHFYLSADLGQHDFTAWTLIRSQTVPYWHTSTQQKLGPRQRVVVAADKFKGVSYPDIVAHLISVMNKPAIAGQCTLSIDGSGVGRACSDYLDENNTRHHAIQMTAGQEWAQKGKYLNVGKTLLIETLSVMFATGELSFAQGLPLRSEIEEDLASFSLKTTAAGNQVIAQTRNASGHGDLGIALAISAFMSQHVGQSYVGESKLDNYW